MLSSPQLALLLKGSCWALWLGRRQLENWASGWKGSGHQQWGWELQSENVRSRRAVSSPF